MQLPIGIPQYFFDDTLIARQSRLVRRWMPATVFPEPVLKPDRAWEARSVALFGTVLPEDGGGYRMYYCDFAPGCANSNLLLAKSRDGFRWDKPDLGIVDWNGSRANNIVISPEDHTDSLTVMLDADDESYPYKSIGFQHGDSADEWGPNSGLHAFRSKDGIRWDRIPGVRLRAGDRTSMMSAKPDGKYVVYTRKYTEMNELIGGRAVYRAESDDFINWSDLELVLAPDLGDEPDVEIYGMSVFERNGWHFGLVEYWRSDTDTIETHLAISRDGKAWMRPMPRTPFIGATYPWNRTWSTCASNGPIIIGDQMVFYFGGRWTAHHYDSAQQYGAIGYASLPIDRFCAIEASGKMVELLGQLDTIPLEWPGGDLAVNADTRESFTSHPANCNGDIWVEVLDADGRPIPEWSGDNRAAYRGNTHCRCRIGGELVRWPQDRSLDLLKGRTISLRFNMRRARLYTFRAEA